MKTIALLGATGNTGKYFLQHALNDKNYCVKALLRTPSKVEDSERLTKVKGDYKSKEAIEDLVKDSDVVVMMANLPRHLKEEDDSVLDAIKMILESMKSNGVKRLIFQAGGFVRLNGEASLDCFSACCIKDFFLGYCQGEREILKSNQRVVDFLEATDIDVQWTVTRPGMLEHKGSKGTAVDCWTDAAKIVTFTDLAMWTLEMIPRTETFRKAPFVKYGEVPPSISSPLSATQRS